MPRAVKRCAKLGCRLPAPCPKHRTWQRSSGQTDLPSNWSTIRKQAEGFDEKRCYVCRRVNPDGQVDHKRNRAQGGSHGRENLGWICREPCHRLKTEAEKQTGRAKKKPTP